MKVKGNFHPATARRHGWNSSNRNGGIDAIVYPPAQNGVNFPSAGAAAGIICENPQPIPHDAGGESR